MGVGLVGSQWWNSSTESNTDMTTILSLCKQTTNTNYLLGLLVMLGSEK